MVVIPNTVQIVKDLVSLITPTINISDIIDNGNDVFTIYTCNTYYLTIEMEINLNGTTYKVIEVNINESFTISKILSSDPDPAGTTLKLNAPFFFNGTIISTRRELDNIEDWRLKYPMVFLYELFEDTGIVDNTNSVGYETRVRLFFMNQTDPINYTSLQQNELIIEPMRALSQEFLNVVEQNSSIVNKLTSDWRLRNWVNFGKFEAEKGMVKKFFTDDLSGCELNINLPIKRSYLDEKYCKC